MTTPARQSVLARYAAPITIHPYIGILGVFLGASTATLNGRLLSVGLPDLRGALGIGFDEASWIPTLFNMGTMFIGVFSVFLGVAYGIRRVLLISGVCYTALSILLPLSPNIAITLALLAAVGIASGSFYTLTLTFVARSLPPKLILFGIAAYALDIVVTSHFASFIEGWYMEHLSWRWIFWTAAALAPLVTACLYFGVPPANAGPRPNWRGFLLMSGGLSLIYGALDQGQRLDWWNSGVFAGMLAAGLFLVLSAFVRRYLQPNPLVNLPFLRPRNVIVLGLGIFCLRFFLLGSLLVIPTFLGNIQRYNPILTGKALAWMAAPEFVLVWIVAIATVFISSRIIMAAGFAAVAVGYWMASRVDSSWAGGSFLVPEMLISAGISAAFVGLVVSIVLLAFEMGAVTSATNMATYAACMHTMRLLGGEIGAVALGRFLTVREQVHSNLLGQNVDAGNWLTGERLGGFAAALAPLSAGPADALARSGALLAGQVRAQAITMACSDAFLLIAWTIAGYLLLLGIMRPSTINIRQLGKAK